MLMINVQYIYRHDIGTCNYIDRMIDIEGIYRDKEKIGREKEIEIYKWTIAGSREPVCVCVWVREREREIERQRDRETKR